MKPERQPTAFYFSQKKGSTSLVLMEAYDQASTQFLKCSTPLLQGQVRIITGSLLCFDSVLDSLLSVDYLWADTLICLECYCSCDKSACQSTHRGRAA